MNELERLKINSRSNEDSVHINDIDVSIYDRIICMDEESINPWLDRMNFCQALLSILKDMPKS